MCPYLLSFGHTPRPPAPAAGTICSAWPVWYRAQTGAACPAFGRVCRCASCCGRSALHLTRPVLPPVMCRPSGCAGGCRGGDTGGVYSRRPAPPGQSRHHRKNKKGSKNHPHPHCQYQKFRRKNKKTPTKGLCSVLYFPYKP